MISDSTPGAEQDKRSFYKLLFDRYIGVWIWSILFGTTTGILYSLLDFRYEKWGTLAVALLVPALLALAFALLSWFELYAGLRDYLIPMFFYPGMSLRECSEGGNSPNEKASENERRSVRFGQTLLNSFRYFIFAALARAVDSLLQLVLGSFPGT